MIHKGKGGKLSMRNADGTVTEVATITTWEVNIQPPTVDAVDMVSAAAERAFGADPQWMVIRDAIASSMTPEDWQSIEQAKASGEPLRWPLSEVAKYRGKDHEV